MSRSLDSTSRRWLRFKAEVHTKNEVILSQKFKYRLYHLGIIQLGVSTNPFKRAMILEWYQDRICRWSALALRCSAGKLYPAVDCPTVEATKTLVSGVPLFFPKLDSFFMEGRNLVSVLWSAADWNHYLDNTTVRAASVQRRFKALATTQHQ